LAILRRKNR